MRQLIFPVQITYLCSANVFSTSNVNTLHLGRSKPIDRKCGFTGNEMIDGELFLGGKTH